MIDESLLSALVFAPIGCFVLAALAAVGFAGLPGATRRLVPSLLTLLGALAGVAAAVAGLLRGAEIVLAGWDVAPFAPLTLRLDPLAAFFLLVISVPAGAAALYGIGYLDAAHDADTPAHGTQPARAVTDSLVAGFLAAMTLVVLADGVFAFLLAWELMSLISFFLVLGNGRQRETRRAAYIYLVMTQIGTAFLLVALLLLVCHAGAMDFETIGASAATLGSGLRDAIFLLALVGFGTKAGLIPLHVWLLVGFGTKAGLIPLHVWLPRAHPAAPSHVSALMSGVMVKIALYGLIRLVWDLAGPGPIWWGGLLLVAGAISAVLGILYALMERDLKRVLAYSTVEHVGIITLGLGAAVVLGAGQHPEAAALAMLAALVHLLNHALFKGLLFLGAGAVQTGVGTRDLERLGGLVKTMPRTAVAVLIGSVAIAALPPLNGFVGEWLLFQSLLQLGLNEATAPMATLAAVAAGALALTGALALACFVRFFGIGFLGQARTEAARQAHEVSRSMQGGMAMLAGFCVVLGVLPGPVLRLLQPVTQSLAGASSMPSLSALPALDPVALQGSYAPLGLVVLLVVVGTLPWLVARLAAGQGTSRLAPPWVCG
ncbi:MAG: dehydrogenase (quinone), partial [Thermomicrobiales bacterium]|nr:dehydrogenase (quinone) [Thermomicrobiales bacterium]